MKNAKSVNYWQIDHQVKRIFAVEGLIVLPILKAWEKFKWVRLYFKEKPQEGYFVWIKKQINFPLSTCLTIASPNTSQELTNFLVIEKGIKAKAIVNCNVQKNNLCGKHIAKGKLILKDGASLEYNHFHKWGRDDLVNPDYEFFLEKNTNLVYNYQSLFPPKNLNLITSIYSKNNSSCQTNFVINGLNSKINLNETIFLQERNSRGILKLRLVGRKNAKIKAQSKIIAKAEGVGHLDCQGLLVDKNSTISLTPKLVCECNQAQLTHEASIGRISEDQLNYLRTRGLTEEEALNLIITGFLSSS
jgi:Fe-S cluster assembly scaffold protein SufB